MDDEESSSENTGSISNIHSNDDSFISWITWYCSLPGHEMLVQVPEYFIEDDFNLNGLINTINHYEQVVNNIYKGSRYDLGFRK
jgi:casein kinase II subunit beta